MRRKRGKKNQKKIDKHLADFLYEVGMLAKTPRSFTSFLGSGEQSVAEHLTRTAYVGYVLAMIGASLPASK